MESSPSDVAVLDCKDFQQIECEKVNSPLENFSKKSENYFESDNAILDDKFLANLLSRSPKDERSEDIIDLENDAQVKTKSDTNLFFQTPCEVDLPDKNSINTDSPNLQNESVCTNITEVSIVMEDTNRTKEIMKTQENKYRCGSDSWSDDDSSTSSDTSSDDDFYQIMVESSVPKKLPAIKTKGELGMDDLPLIEDLVITVNEEEMMMVGKIHAVVDKLVVIHAIKEKKPLDLDSVLFLSYNKPLGRVFDVFGSVVEPFYCVRFNSTEDIKNKGIEIGADVFFAPEKTDLTSYVFVDELQKQKGSDASWKHNNEPPEEVLDFSDDEEEKAARRRRSARNRNRQYNSNSEIAFKRPAIADNSSVQPNFSSRPSSPENTAVNYSGRFPRRNPFSSTPLPSKSPAPSIQSLLSAVTGPSVYAVPPPQIAFSQTQRSFPQQGLLQRPSSPLVFTSFPPPPVFGQVALLSPLSTQISSPPPPLHSPFMHNVPGSPLPVTPQNYFHQRFPANQPPLPQAPFAPGNSHPRFQTSPSPLTHPSLVSGNYLQLNQRFQGPVPVSVSQYSSSDTWPPIRPAIPLNVSAPILPLSVQIPHQNGSPLTRNTFQPNGIPFQPFINNTNMNTSNMPPRFY